MINDFKRSQQGWIYLIKNRVKNKKQNYNKIKASKIFVSILICFKMQSIPVFNVRSKSEKNSIY